jgi:hypothetical protein
MASAEFDDKIESKKPTIQVGDPFQGKKVMEACLEWGIAMERYGVWGATTPHERFAIRKRHNLMVNDPQHNP